MVVLLPRFLRCADERAPAAEWREVLIAPPCCCFAAGNGGAQRPGASAAFTAILEGAAHDGIRVPVLLDDDAIGIDRQLLVVAGIGVAALRALQSIHGGAAFRAVLHHSSPFAWSLSMWFFHVPNHVSFRPPSPG